MSKIKDYGRGTVEIDSFPFVHEGKTYQREATLDTCAVTVVSEVCGQAEHQPSLDIAAVARNLNEQGFEEILEYPYDEWSVRLTEQDLLEVIDRARQKYNWHAEPYGNGVQ